MDLQKISIYRMTHVDNVPHILKYGITHKNSKNFNREYITIGDISLINTRDDKTVLVDNGVFSVDSKAITLGHFIPFYFGVRMPMLYVMQNGGNFVKQATPAKDIIYLACSISCIKQSNVFYFSDGHATDNYTTFYNKSKFAELPTIIDWSAVKASYWGGQEDLDIKRKKQAEFLVAGDVSPDCLVGFGCYNDEAKKKLLSIGVEGEKIKVIPNAYF